MPDIVHFRFYAELNDFLPTKKRNIKEHAYPLRGKNSVKDAIESFGIPHTEVDLILVNQKPVSFSYHLHPLDQVSVYPVFESFDILGISHLRSKPLRHPAFVLDVHLGRLARWLRTAGFDTLYRNDYRDDEIIDLSVAEKRIVLTRDIGILKNSRVTHGYFVRQIYPGKQFGEIIQRFHLSREMISFSRCIHCNHPLVKVKKSSILNHLQPLTKKYYDEFMQCPRCGKIYWKGSHYQRMKKKLEMFADQTS
ncbi:MAG: Mut7-C ubiquitin/RNAse domain-containing protein [Chlorobi bacterium]|nr:Mut7-C ubiquitin/RNAse domain-containing protein [Chlorobiota bacterium]